MERETVKAIIRPELPDILREDPEMERFVLRLTRERYADRVETNARFDRMLEQIERHRAESERRWQTLLEEEARKWDEQVRRWEEQDRK